MPYFICPRCAQRSLHGTRTQGTGYQRPRGCDRCGFGFLFEILEDYMPAATSVLFVTDQQLHVLGAGKHQFTLTGRPEDQLIGRPLREALGLRFEGEGPDPIDTTLEWGVRAFGKPMSFTRADGSRVAATADLFPAYDDDGGLLMCLWEGAPA
jgi:hypothetical protein